MPGRSTTRAGTDHLTSRALLAAFAVLILAALGWLLGQRPVPPAAPASTSAPSAAAPQQPLVVGDGRTATLISLGGPHTDALLNRVAEELDPVVRRVEAFWGADWSRDIVVVTTATDTQFEAQAGGANAEMAAVAVADEVDPARRTVLGQRIVLAPGAAAMSADSLRIVLGHELFHYAARADTAMDAPRWLTEGIADFVARPATAVPDRLKSAAALPSDAEFTAEGAQLSDAYDRAWLFARFVADSYGAPTLKLLYEQAAGPGHADIAAAFRDALHAEPDEVLVRWNRWLNQ